MTDAPSPGEALVLRRLELAEREEELVQLLRRTRFTVPLWVAGFLYFVWAGWRTGSWPPAALMALFALVAGGVGHWLRRGRRRELEGVREELRALPSTGPG